MSERIIFGGDKRQIFLAEKLRQQGISVSFADKKEDFLKKDAVILAPVPFTKDQTTCFFSPEAAASFTLPASDQKNPKGHGLCIDEFLSFLSPGQILFGGSLPENVREFCTSRQILWADYMEMEEVCIQNAVATAEGAVCEAIIHSPLNLQKSFCLLGGYGRCGRILAWKLRGMGALVTVLDCDKIKLAQAQADGFSTLCAKELPIFPNPQMVQFLFNTIPQPVFDRKFLEKTSDILTVLDLSSAPGGVDMDYCREKEKTALLCPGLPGKYSPLTSAEILCKALLSHPEFSKRLS